MGGDAYFNIIEGLENKSMWQGLEGGWRRVTTDWYPRRGVEVGLSLQSGSSSSISKLNLLLPFWVLMSKQSKVNLRHPRQGLGMVLLEDYDLPLDFERGKILKRNATLLVQFQLCTLGWEPKYMYGGDYFSNAVLHRSVIFPLSPLAIGLLHWPGYSKFIQPVALLFIIVLFKCFP